jgi:hypothetical protein
LKIRFFITMPKSIAPFPYPPALLGQALFPRVKENGMADVFISYSRKDKAFVQTLHEALGAREREPWID